jgi:hypothetical protein
MCSVVSALRSANGGQGQKPTLSLGDSEKLLGSMRLERGAMISIKLLYGSLF